MPKNALLPWLLFVSLNSLVSRNFIEAAPNFDIEVEDQFAQDEFFELEGSHKTPRNYTENKTKD